MAEPLLKAGELRSPSFLRVVRRMGCCAPTASGRCGKPSEPHHYPSKGAMGVTRDDMTCPLCRDHHDLAQTYQIHPDIQRQWVDETRSRFMREATAEEMSEFFVDWTRWKVSRGESVPW